jgi:hypothetical protein
MRTQRIAIWLFVTTLPILAVTFWLLAGFIPLPAPTMTADEVAALYTDNAVGIRLTITAWVLLWGAWLPFSAVLAAQLSRLEHGFPFWSLLQFGGGVVFTMIVVLTSLLWGVAGFRPDRAPEVVLALNDLGWFLFTMPAIPLGLQIFAVGIVALGGKATSSAFPRWFGYLSLWVFTLTLPGCVIIMFKTGPLAWNGVLAIMIPAAALGTWICFLIPMLLRAIGTPTPVAGESPQPS